MHGRSAQFATCGQPYRLLLQEDVLYYGITLTASEGFVDYFSERRIRMKKCLPLLLALLAIAAAPAANAQQGYFGVGLGFTSVDLGLSCSPGLSCSFDEEDTAIRIFGGARINPNFALEAFYADLGEAGGSFTDGVDTETITAEASAFGVAALGIIPVSQNFELFGKFGFAMWDADVTFNSTTVGTLSGSDDGTDPVLGIGAQWRSDKFALRAEYEKFELDDVDVDVLSVNAVFHF